jgi:DNA-binding transcriptional ArsR family regulator
MNSRISNNSKTHRRLDKPARGAKNFNRSEHEDNAVTRETPPISNAENPVPENNSSNSAILSKVNEAKRTAEATRKKEVTAASDLNPILPEDSPFGPIDEKPEKHYKLWDASQVENWTCPPIRWLIQDLIQFSSIAYIFGSPKIGKSLLTLYISLLLSQPQSGRKFLDRFACESAKILYLSNEDGASRIKERIPEIRKTHNLFLPAEGNLIFRFRAPFQFTRTDHVEEIKQLIKTGGFNLVVFDTLSRSTVGMDENSAKDIGELTSILENIRDETGVTILCIDHSRKPQGLNGNRYSQEPNPYNLRGSIAKYAMAESIIGLERKSQTGRLLVATENKDTDKRLRFFIDVSPKDSPEAKFKYGGEIGSASSKTSTALDVNRSNILAAIGGDWVTRKQIEKKVGLPKSTVQGHLDALVKAGLIIRQNKGQTAYYRKPAQGANTGNSVGKS